MLMFVFINVRIIIIITSHFILLTYMKIEGCKHFYKIISPENYGYIFYLESSLISNSIYHFVKPSKKIKLKVFAHQFISIKC